MNEINNLTTNQLASKCFTSLAGIIRFCYCLGLEGINELKFKIKYLQQNYYLEGHQFNVTDKISEDALFFKNI